MYPDNCQNTPHTHTQVGLSLSLVKKCISIIIHAAYLFAFFVCGQAQLPWRVSAVQMWRSEDSLQQAALSSRSLKPGAQTRVIGVATRALPGTRPSGSECGLLHLASGSSDDL